VITVPDTVVRGLRVQRHHTGKAWIIIHEQSGTHLGLWLRLRRHAEAARDEFAATGEDFTLTRDQLMENQFQRRPEAVAVGALLGRWTDRVRYCCENGEHYDPLTYAMEGRCIGPLSNGKPRRS
jgi:hypothetical protein